MREPMKCWVVKGSLKNDWTQLVKGREWVWWTSKLADQITRGDRVFFWQSWPACQIVGLGEVVNPKVRKNRNGTTSYAIRCLTGMLNAPADMARLRRVQHLRSASFLKRGAGTCVFPITDEQAQATFLLLAESNPAVQKFWRDFDGDVPKTSSLVFVDVDMAATEGSSRLVEHLQRERNQQLVARKKSAVLAREGKLVCECCGFDFKVFYGSVSGDFCEAHHRKPLSSKNGNRKTSLSDLAILCSNCHRVMHLTDPMMSVKELSNLVTRQRKLISKK